MKKFFVLLVAIALSTMLYAAKGGEQGSSHGQPFLTLQGQILTLQDQIDQLVGDADTVEKRLAGLESATEILEDDVEDLNADLDGLHAEVSQLRGYVSDNTDNINKNLDYIIEIRGVIELVGDEIISMEGYTRATLEMILDDLVAHESAINANHILIEAMGDEIAAIEANMELKQNIIDGRCPEGQALVAVNTDENDAVMICETVSGAGDLLQTERHTYTRLNANQTTTLTVQCPADYIALSGGFDTRSTHMKVLASQPVGNRWEVTAKNESRYPLFFGIKVNCLKLQ